MHERDKNSILCQTISATNSASIASNASTACIAFIASDSVRVLIKDKLNRKNWFLPSTVSVYVSLSEPYLSFGMGFATKVGSFISCNVFVRTAIEALSEPFIEKIKINRFYRLSQ